MEEIIPENSHSEKLLFGFRWVKDNNTAQWESRVILNIIASKLVSFSTEMRVQFTFVYRQLQVPPPTTESRGEKYVVVRE